MFLLWCSGATGEILNRPECHTVRGYHATLGATVVLTSVFATFSAGFFLATAEVPGILITPVALLWGAFIATMDRALIGSLIRRRDDTWRSIAVAAVPRLAIGLLMANIVAEPLVQRLFRDDIALELARDDLLEREEAAERVNTRFGPELEALQLEAQDIRGSLAERERLAQEAYQAASDEADGIGGTGIRGRGPRFSEKQVRYEQLRDELRREQDEAATALARIAERRAAIERLRAGQIETVVQEAERSRGVLRQREALHRLMDDPESGGPISRLVWLIKLILVAVELAPLWGKVLVGRRSPYDAAWEQAQEDAIATIDAQRQSEAGDRNAHARVRAAVRDRAEELLLARITQEGAPDDDSFWKDHKDRVRSGLGLTLQGMFAGQTPDDPVESDHANGDPWAHHKDPPRRWPGPDPDHSGPSGPHVSPTVDFGDAPFGRNGDAPNAKAGPRWARVAVTASEGLKAGGVAVAKRIWGSRWGRTSLAALGAGLLAIGGAAAVTAKYWARPCVTGPCPIAEWVDGLRAQTRIVDPSGELFATVPAEPPPALEELPAFLPAQLMAIEDHRFMRHAGVDVISAVGALVGNVLGRGRRGASTIEMQLGRCADRANTMWPDGTWAGKFAEAAVALSISRDLSKDEILGLYFACQDWGTNAGVSVRGITDASWTYFGKPPRDLRMDEGATLVGMLQGTSLHHPGRNPRSALERRDVVLRRLAEEFPEYRDSVQVAREAPLEVLPLDRIQSPSLSAMFAAAAAPAGGLGTMRTSVVVDLQRAVEGELLALLRGIEAGQYGPYEAKADDPLIGALVVGEAGTGRLRAYSCGRPLGLTVQWDPCRHGEIGFGSTIKAFTFSEALDIGVVRPEDTLLDLIERADDTPSAYRAQVCEQSRARLDHPVRALLAESDNCAAVVIHQLLPPTSFARLRNVGVAMEPTSEATSLGTARISLLDLAALAGGIENGGEIPSWTVLETTAASETGNGNRLPFRPSTIDEIRRMLADVVRSGTAVQAARELPAGASSWAKTGTAPAVREVVMVGAVDGIVLALWVGHLSGQHPITTSGSAGTLLASTWGRIAATALETRARGSWEPQTHADPLLGGIAMESRQP